MTTSASEQTDTNGVVAHVEPQFEGGEVENVPEVRSDVIRETDRNDVEELPESGMKSALLSLCCKTRTRVFSYCREL